MKVLNPQSATLSNYEVFAHLVSRREASLVPVTAQTQNASSSATSTERRQMRERERDPRPQQRKLKAPNYEAVSREILEYLSPGSTSTTSIGSSTGSASTTSHSHSHSHSQSQSLTKAQTTHPLPPYSQAPYSSAAISKLLHQLAGYNLTKAELLLIVNLRPSDPASLDAVVEEVDERFDEAAQTKILDVVRTCLGP